jgi:acyl carrier protein
MTVDPETLATVRASVKKILVEVLALKVVPSEIGDNQPLFEGRLGVDSIAALEILAEIEKRFGIDLPDDAIDLAMFESVASMAETVVRYLPKEMTETPPD